MIAVLGNFVVDLIGKPVEKLPESGKLLVMETLQAHAGGNGANTAGALAKLGSRTAALGAIGDDLFGDFLTQQLIGWGVDCGGIQRLNGVASGVTFVAVDLSGERSFLHHFGAGAHLRAETVTLPPCDHFHLASFFVLPELDGAGAAELLSRARSLGASTSLDVAWDHSGQWLSRLAPALPWVDWMMPSKDEAAMLTGREELRDMAQSLLDLGCGHVIIKCGVEGAYYWGPLGEIAEPALSIGVVDATGAGDCFAAGFLHCLGRGASVPAALEFGCICGGRSVAHFGAVGGLLPADEMYEWAGRAEGWAQAERPFGAT